MRSLSTILFVGLALQALTVSNSHAASKSPLNPPVCSTAPTPFDVTSKIDAAQFSDPQLRQEYELHHAVYGVHFVDDWDKRLGHFTKLNQTGRVHLVYELADDAIEAADWDRAVELANKYAPGLNRSLIYQRLALAAGQAGVGLDKFNRAATAEFLKSSGFDYWYSLGVGLTQGPDAAKRVAAGFDASPSLEVFLQGMDGNVDGFVPFVEARQNKDRRSQAAYSYGDIGPAFLLGTLVSKDRAAFNRFINLDLPGSNRTVIENAFRFLMKKDRDFVIRKQILKNVEHEKVLSDFMEKQIRYGGFLGDVDLLLDLVNELHVTFRPESWLMIFVALIGKEDGPPRILKILEQNPKLTFKRADIREHYKLDIELTLQIVAVRIRNQAQLNALRKILEITDLPLDQKRSFIGSAEKAAQADKISPNAKHVESALKRKDLLPKEALQLAKLIERVCYGPLMNRNFSIR